MRLFVFGRVFHLRGGIFQTENNPTFQVGSIQVGSCFAGGVKMGLW